MPKCAKTPNPAFCQASWPSVGGADGARGEEFMASRKTGALFDRQGSGGNRLGSEVFGSKWKVEEGG
ncbi:hypothetical protein GCM10009566_17220 [Streptomyces murinus]